MIAGIHLAMRRLSDMTANGLSHPGSMLAVLAGCGLWLGLGGSEAVLASTVSIAAFVATLMVLNQQRRRDQALHLKIDELILAKQGARDEVAGIEHGTEEEMRRLVEGRDTLDAGATAG